MSPRKALGFACVVVGLAAACGEENTGSEVRVTGGAGAAQSGGASAGTAGAPQSGAGGGGQGGAPQAGAAGKAQAGSGQAGGAQAGNAQAGNAQGGKAGGAQAGTAGKAQAGAGVGGASAGAAQGGKAGSTQAGCLGQLDAAGISYKKTSAKGVVDAVNVLGPIEGVLFTSGDTTKPSGDPMACEFVLTLRNFAAVLKARGFVRIGTLGSYCYRCCCAWSSSNYCRGPNDPEPSCGSSGFSNHSWGRAVDVRWLVKADGTKYDVNDPTDYVKFATTDTCGAGLAAQSGVSLELYSLVCELKAKKVFSTILTPNYNSSHRNHFHMDIGQSGPPSGFVVKSWEAGEIDDGEHADSCGGDPSSEP